MVSSSGVWSWASEKLPPVLCCAVDVGRELSRRLIALGLLWPRVRLRGS